MAEAPEVLHAPERRLAAILAADIAGYSRLMSQDEGATVHDLKAHQAVVLPMVPQFGGTIIDTAGDGILAQFPSAVRAVECAVAIQKLMAERNVDVPEGRHMQFRIGVNLGDIIYDGIRVYGDGVNIAARLESIAKPGAICLSEDAYRQVKSRLDLNVSDLGPIQLKNISEPVRVYCSEVDKAAPAKPAAPSAGQAQSLVPRLPRLSSLRLAAVVAALLLLAAACGWYLLGWRGVKPFEAAHLSLVVLPFANLSGDPSQDYFADGITESLTTDLSRIRNSFVIARDTAFAFKGRNADARQIGRELGVRYVLEGSVQRDQNQVRVNAQLIDAESGGHIWAERFDRTLANIFSLQDEIVASLASQLNVELINNEARRAEQTSNPDSMDLYFQGMSWYNKGRSALNMAEARHFFERALALDPGNLDASLGTVAVDMQVAVGYETDDRSQLLSTVEATLTKVLSLSPNNAWAHFWMGRVDVQTNRGAQGIAECERALALSPNLASAHALIGLAKLFEGRPEETESHELEALRVSPYDTDANVWVAYIALAKLHLGADEEALVFYRRSKELNPNYATGRFSLASALAQLGRLDEARAEVQAGLALNPGFTIRRYRAGAQSDNPLFLKRRERIIEGMRKAGVPEG